MCTINIHPVVCDSGQTPAAPPFTKKPGSIKGGDLIIMDVESLLAPRPGLGIACDTCAGPDYHDMCVWACARTPGCNAYSYCDKESGCGTGCKAYSKDNPQRELGMMCVINTMTGHCMRGSTTTSPTSTCSEG